MPCKCSVPGCKSNYKGHENNVGTFRLPHDPLQKEFWLNMLPAHGNGIVLSEHTRICAKHFLDRFIYKRDINGPGGRKKCRLTKDAYPSIFPHVKSGLTVTSENGENGKFLDVLNTTKFEIDNWISTDKITNFSSFCREAKNYLEGDRWLYELDKSKEKYDKECIQFYMMHNTPGDPRPLFTVTVFSDMHVNVHSDISGYIPERDLHEIFGEQPPPILVYWSQFVAVISKCSIGYWVSSRDFQPNFCINDLHELPVVDIEDQTMQLLNNEATYDESSSLPTTEAFGATVKEDIDKALRNINDQLTQKLFNVIFQRNQLLKKMENIQDLASINLDILNVVLIIDENPEGMEEMEKVYRLVKTIKNDVEEMADGQSVFPEWIKKNSNVIQDGDLLQMKFPAFEANSHSTFDNTRLEADDDGEMKEGYSHHQSDSCSNNLGDQSLVNILRGEEEERKEGNDDGGIEPFPSQDDEEDGNENRHSESFGFMCQICGKRLKSQRGLVQHQSILHKETISNQCQINENSPSENFGFMCQICGKKYKTQLGLLRHEHHSHKETFSTQCHICGKKCKIRSNLQIHMFVHSEKKQFQCSVCGKFYKHWSTYHKHNRIEHIRARSYKCRFCGKIFYHKQYLNSHEKSHDNGTAKRIYPDRSKYERGREKHLHCNVCDKRFDRMSMLNNHMVSHSDARPFKCNLCGMAFKMELYLKRHIILHNDERPFECTVCPKKFKTRDQRTTHVRQVHIEVARFRCDVCGKTFKWKRTFQKHKAVHSENIQGELASNSQTIDEKEIVNDNEESCASGSGGLVMTDELQKPETIIPKSV